jgi:hypothetical protein
MRRIAYGLSVCVLALVSLPAYATFATQRPTEKNAESAQQVADCHDDDFLSTVSDDVNTFSSNSQQTNINDPLEVIKYLRSLAKLRQKYEDMQDIPTDCYPIQVQISALYANEIESVNSILFKTVDPSGIEQYAKDQVKQAARVGEQLDLLLAQLSGEEKATPES